MTDQEDKKNKNQSKKAPGRRVRKTNCKKFAEKVRQAGERKRTAVVQRTNKQSEKRPAATKSNSKSPSKRKTAAPSISRANGRSQDTAQATTRLNGVRPHHSVTEFKTRNPDDQTDAPATLDTPLPPVERCSPGYQIAPEADRDSALSPTPEMAAARQPDSANAKSDSDERLPLMDRSSPSCQIVPEPVRKVVVTSAQETQVAHPVDEEVLDAPEHVSQSEPRTVDHPGGEDGLDNAARDNSSQTAAALNGHPTKMADDAELKNGKVVARKPNQRANGSASPGPTPMEGRESNVNFREVLGKGLSSCRRNMVTVGIFSFAVNVLILSIPIYLFNISDRVLTSRSTDTLVMLSVVVVGALLMHVLLDISRRFILMRTAVQLESTLGAPVLSAAAQASQNGSSREFQILGELQHVRNFITGPVLLTMFDTPAAPLYLAVVFLIHPHLGFIVAGTGLFLLAIAAINQKMTAVPFGRANAFATRANLQADAMARNAQVMNSMGMIPEGVRIWGKETAASLSAQVSAQDRNILLASLSKFIRLCTQVGILGWGAWLAISGELTGGMIIAASIVGSRALAPIEGTIEGWRSFVQARSAYARIKILLQNSALNADRLRLPRPKGQLNVERVLFVPPPNKKVILNGISFALEPGESLAIVGESGTGKTTLGKMLVGSIFPTAGSVRLDMMDLRNWDPCQFGENVGYLPQDVQLFPATIRENIARMRTDVSDESIFDAAEMADVHGMISEFAQGYETMVAMDGSPLSGGQKQRIGLARAFFGDPRFVVLDEPNSNLDSPGERALARALEVAKSKDITVVAITQRPSLLRSVDKIMILKNGTAQALGNRDDIIPLLSSSNKQNGASQTNAAPMIDA